MPPPSAQEPSPATETIVVVDAVWRARVEADLRAAHDAVARLDADRATDAQSLRAAVSKWSDSASSNAWAEQLARMQDRLNRQEQAIQASAERAAATDQGPQPRVERTEADRDQVEALSRVVAELREQQEAITATLAVVSEGLAAERLRSTVMILAGAAIALASAAVWLMTNTLAS